MYGEFYHVTSIIYSMDTTHCIVIYTNLKIALHLIYKVVVLNLYKYPRKQDILSYI